MDKATKKISDVLRALDDAIAAIDPTTPPRVENALIMCREWLADVERDPKKTDLSAE